MPGLLSQFETKAAFSDELLGHVRESLFLFKPYDGTLHYVNERSCQKLDSSEDELLGQKFFELGSIFDSPETFREAMTNLNEDERRFTGKFRRSDGTTYPVDLKVTPVSIEGEDYVLATARDDSDRRETMQSLRRARQIFRQFDEHIDQVFWMTDLDGDDLLYVSDQFEDVWGYPTEVLRRDPELWMKPVVETDRHRVRSFMEDLRSGTGDSDGKNVRYRIERPDGEVRWIRDRGFPVRDEQGEVYRLAGVAEDITARILDRRREKRREKLDSIGDMAAKVMHEINNPNAAIQGNVEYLKRTWEKLDTFLDRHEGGAVSRTIRREVPEVLDAVSRSTRRIEELVEDVKQFARESGLPRDRVYELSDVPGLLEDVLEKYRREESSVVEVNCTVPDTVRTRVSREKLKLVLNHLVDNAVQATEDVPNPRVQIKLEEAEGGLSVVVEDNGPGIPEDERDKVTDIFYSTRDESEGTGLGLSIVATITEQAGGDLVIRGEEGEGAVVEVALPRAE